MSQPWIHKDQSELADWQKRISDVATDSFCVLPWIHVSTKTNGDLRVCCVANSGGAGTDNSSRGVIKNSEGLPTNLGTTPVEQAWNQQYFKDIRTTMLAGSAPASCERCYREESQGIASKRIWETLTWQHRGTDIQELIANTHSDGRSEFKTKYLDLRLGNTCNLGCVMCSSHDSSYWYQDHEQTYSKFTDPAILDQRRFKKDVYQNQWWTRGEFWQTVEQQIPNLEQIAFAGGEPLLIKQQRQLLKKIIEQSRSSHIQLRYTTNGTVLDTELLELWSHFKEVHISVSMDAVGSRLNYIRYPIDPAVLEHNLRILDQTGDNIKVNLAVAVQILNILHIPDFVQWKVQQEYQKINLGYNISGHQDGGGLMVPNLVWTPTWFSIRSLPMEYKQKVTAAFDQLESWLKQNYTTDDDFWNKNPYGWRRWQGILAWMWAEDHSENIKSFQQYMSVMDRQRNSDFAAVFPELAGLKSWP
jgi:sulfatase maturation enzyme AslB (radical SAM superfamily)